MGFASQTYVNKMADEPVVDLNAIEENINKTNKVEERIKELSGKVKLTSEERDELKKSKDKLESENVSLKKEVEFHSSFSKAVSKYPQATEFQDDIKGKVLAGYTMDDATVSVLASKGKLTMPTPERESAAGGSAVTPPLQSGQKPINEMTRDEKRAMLMQMEKDGAIGMS